MDDDRADDAASKWHSTVGGAVSVAAAIADALEAATSTAVSSAVAAGSGGCAGRPLAQLRLLGAVLTHFSQRYPRLPPLAVSDAAGAIDKGSDTDVSAVKDVAATAGGAGSANNTSRRDRGGRADAASSSKHHHSAARGDGARMPWALHPESSASSLAAAARRTLFAFDGMCVPLVSSLSSLSAPAPVTRSPHSSSGDSVVHAEKGTRLRNAATSGLDGATGRDTAACSVDVPFPALCSVFDRAGAIMQAVHAALEEA